MVVNDMKKTIAALALVAGLTSFAGSAKASVITANLSEFTSGSSTIGFGYKNGVITSDYNDGIDGRWEAGIEGMFPAFGIIGLGNNQSAGDGYYNLGNTPLQYGVLIDELMSYGTSGAIPVDESTGGYWAARFNAGNGFYNYGWVQVDVTSSGMTFGMAGVETTPNLAITAGAVPEPSTYTLLLLSGAASLYALKRRKS